MSRIKMPPNAKSPNASKGFPARDSVAKQVVLDYEQGIALFRPVGTVSLFTAVGLIETAIRQAASQCDALMVSITALSGFGSPSIPARHEMMRKWAQVGDGRLRLALVVPSGFLDPDHYGETAAANLGLIVKGFLEEAEALAWLRAP